MNVLASIRRLLRFEQLGLAAILLALALLLVSSEVLQRWDNLFYDAQLTLARHAAPSEIVIVEIDDESIAELGRWPWARALHARLIERLTEAGAAVIGMDILFREPDLNDPAGDARLASAIAAHGAVVLPVAPESSHGERLIEALPMPNLAPAALGHVDVELEADGVVRRSCMRAGLATARWPSLAQAMWRLARGDVPTSSNMSAPSVNGSARSAWVREDCFLVPFFGSKDAFQHVSFARVLEDEPAQLEHLRGRLVLVGTTAVGLGSSFVTPVSGLGAPMSGVELSANILGALAQHSTIHPLGALQRTLLTIALALVPVFVLPHCRPRSALIAYGLLLLAVMLISLVLLRFANLWFPPAAALAVIAVSYPLWSWRRLDSIVGQLRRERNLATATLNAIGDAVITTDRAGRVAYLNPVAESLTGFTYGEAYGQPLATVVRTYDETGERPVPPPLDECLTEGMRIHPSSYVLLRADGERAIRWSGAPIRDGDGQIDGMVLAFSDITQILSLSRDMVHQATHDALTGLPNRVLMKDRLAQALARARRAGEHVALMFIDLDGFKRVNDAFGHTAGDALLQEVARRLKTNCREEDSVARWGGDEFVVMLEKLQTRDTVVRRASHILESLAQPIDVLEQELYITASIGICMSPRDGE
ncbi:MAG: CHASE2 domain-containing protein, partial [Burkholderiales bacterium]|nr:CHASE2 domain-containing protein [Burkholderiales bacterium]